MPCLGIIGGKLSGGRLVAPGSDREATEPPTLHSLSRNAVSSRPIIPLQIDNTQYLALVDSGADMVLFSTEIPNLNISPCVGTHLQLAAEGHEIPVLGKAKVLFHLRNESYEVQGYVAKGLQQDVILGGPFLFQEKVILDYDRCCLYLGIENRQTVYWRMPKPAITQNIRLPTIPDNTPSEIPQLLKEFQETFDEGLQQPTTRTTKHVIRLKDDTPINKRCYHMSPEKKRILYQQVDDMLRAGVIEPSVSPYSSPPVLVARDGKAPRFCVDYRLLNDKTLDESSTLPRIQDTLKSLSQAKSFSVLDLKSGYWQIPLDEGVRPYTAFSTPDGAQYQFIVMPFGLKNAPSTFQKLMSSEVLVGMVHNFVQVYLDDIIVYSNSYEEHLYHLRLVFERLQLHNLKVSADKCSFLQEDLNYLGYHIRGPLVEPQTKHLDQIRSFPSPKNRKQLQSFIGTVNWLREHIPNLSELMAPLSELLKGPAKKFLWTRDLETAFERIKSGAAAARPLSRPNFNHPFILQTDASAIGMSAVLYQEIEGKRHVISHASAKFKPAEQKYHVNEQECLALVWSINLYRGYLEDKTFIVRTDSRSLTWLSKFKDTKSKLTRWALTLQEYSFKVEHVPGSHNQLPDFLSRHPEETPYKSHPDDERLLPPEVACTSDPDQSNPFIAEVNVGTIYEKIARTQRDVRHIHRTIVMLQHLENHDPTTPAQRKLKARFCIDEGLLWRRNPAGDRLVVPRHLVQQLIHIYHDIEDSAHPGKAETNRKIGEHYFWGCMYSDIKNYVNNCVVCSLAKTRQLQPDAPLHARSPTKPFEMISLDVLGPYPEAVGTANRYILIIEDVFSKWVEAQPLKEVKSRQLLEVLETHVTSRYGYPRVIVSDNGGVFISNDMRRFCETHDIQQLFSSTSHQQANPVERRVQELKKVLKVLLMNSRESYWERKLSKALQVLRSRVNRATGQSPAQIILGHDLPCPGEWRTKWGQHRRTKTPRERQHLHREVFARQLDFQRKEYHNPAPPAISFNPGDRVNVRNFVPGAFAPAWTGPHEIVACTGDTTYEVLVNGHQSNIHVNDLRPARVGNPDPFEDESPYASSVSSEDEFPAVNLPDAPPSVSDTDDEPERASGPEDVPDAPTRANTPQPSTSTANLPLSGLTLSAPAQRALDQVSSVEAEVIRYVPQVIGFKDIPDGTQHRHLEEMLTRELLKLDNVINPGEPQIRAKRKQVIALTEELLSRLDSLRTASRSEAIVQTQN